MPVVELSLQKLQKLVGEKVTKHQLLTSLPFLGLDIESVSENTVRVEYSPNRPDYSTDFGISLGLQGILGIKKGLFKLNIKNSNYRISVNQSVSKIRPFITGIIAKNGLIDDHVLTQLINMQEDLHFGLGRNRKKSSIGIHDLDAIKFPLTYTTSKRNLKFIPLYSNREQSIDQIIKKTDVGKKYGNLLGNSNLVPVLLDSFGRIISLPPIINSAMTTVTTKTKNLLVEVTGLNKKDVEDVLSVIATTLQAAKFELFYIEIVGGKNSKPNLEERKMELDPNLLIQTIGLNLSTRKTLTCIKKSRLDAKAVNKKIQCIIPRYRFDIFGPMDLVEEVVLGYGIENLSPVISPSYTIGQKNSRIEKLNSISTTMIGLGLIESLHSSLTSSKILYDLPKRSSSGKISVLNSKSQEYTVLRDLILPDLIYSLSKNIHEQYPQKLFEIGTVFLRNNPITEKFHLSAVISHKDANYSEIKSILKSLCKKELCASLETKPTSHPLFEEGHSAQVIINDKPSGFIGEINHHIIDDLKIRMPVAGFEIELIFD